STSIGVTTLLVLRMASTARSILGNSGSLRNVATVGLRLMPVDPAIGHASPVATRTHGVCACSHCGPLWPHEQPQGSPARTPAHSPAWGHSRVPDITCAAPGGHRRAREYGCRLHTRRRRSRGSLQ